MQLIKEIKLGEYRPLDKFDLSDLEMTRMILRGGSVLDWNRLNFTDENVAGFISAHRLDPKDLNDVELVNRIRDEAIHYLTDQFDFPVPKPVRQASFEQLLLFASNSSSKHRQVCACTVLKAMHIINHFDAAEARQALKVTDQDLYFAAEQVIYRTVSTMMADQLPVVEFMGGRKQRASMVTKLLSKPDPLSAQLFDKMRFRIVTATRDDILPTINYLVRNLFPFNYVLSGESYNTLFPFREYCESNVHLASFAKHLQVDPKIEETMLPMSNTHSSPRYKVVHWVADMPIKIKNYQDAYNTDGVNPVPRPLVFVRAEIQILDRKTHRQNERGHASHKKYKQRQQKFVTERLKVGLVTAKNK